MVNDEEVAILQNVAEQWDRAQFGGLSVDAKDRAVTFFLKRPSGLALGDVGQVAGLIERVRAEWPTSSPGMRTYRLVVAASDSSISDGELFRDQVRSGSWTPGLRDRVATFWVDAGTNRVHLGLEGLTSEDVSAAQKAFSDRVVLFPDSRGEKFSTRAADPAPHTGGLKLNTCSGAFRITVGGVQRMLTAGHCGSGTFSNNGSTVGSTVALDYTNGGYDSQYISGSFRAYIYSGCLGCGAVRAVSGTWAPWVGENDILVSGATSGQAGFYQITGLNLCHTYTSGWTTCHLDSADYMGSLGASYPGDSGGAVYVQNGAKAQAVGTVDGGNGSVLYFSRIQDVLSRWGATLSTA